MIKVLLCITSADNTSLITKEYVDQFNSTVNGFEITLRLNLNNTKSLAEVYNQSLKEARTVNEYDFIMFAHSDILLNLQSFIPYMSTFRDKYDVMGLAGCKVSDTKISPFNWFTSSIQHVNTRYGRVVMKTDKGYQDTFYNKAHHPQVLDTPVSMIDGLCIIFGPNAINSNLTFDEKIAKYDFYDSDISFQILLDYKLKLGVIVFQVLHQSIGKSIMSDEFLKSELIFRDKWNLDIPPGSRLETIVFNN